MKSRFPFPAIILFMALCAGQFFSPSRAWSAAEKGVPDAQTLIDGCWEGSLAKRSNPNTEVIRSGILDTVLCLEAVIVDQFSLYSPNLWLPHEKEQGLTTTEKVKAKLKNLRFAAGGLYWWIYMDNPGCLPTCGTIYATFHLSENAEILEIMIRVMFQKRKEFNF
ncbi:MAG TPA: hypothetical protein QGH84_05035 [Rhodospirillales bacterium]|jgi:hypothetical protein|nr:hypothetical protein [Rhodospirillales bacterium]